MNILVIGDVTSPKGIDHLERNLWRVREDNRVDFTVVNGENASFITGISRELAERLLRSGADVITGGNHTLQNRAAHAFLEECPEILRPLNYGDSAPGRGYTIADARGYRILVMNAMGNVHIEPVLDSPFSYVERTLRSLEGRYDFSMLDIHAEATGEKLAVAHAFDGRIDIVFGTHTHVPTADLQTLPRGTAYVTDIGMCGESGGILGMNAALVVERMRTHILNKFTPADGTPFADAVLFNLDTTTGRVIDMKRLRF